MCLKFLLLILAVHLPVAALATELRVPIDKGLTLSSPSICSNNQTLTLGSFAGAISAINLPEDIKKFCQETQSDYKTFQSNQYFDPKHPLGLNTTESWSLSLVPQEAYRKGALVVGLLHVPALSPPGDPKLNSEISEGSIFEMATKSPSFSCSRGSHFVSNVPFLL